MANINKSTDDYPTLAALNAAENNKPSDNIMFDIKTNIVGGFLDKFLGDLTITTSNGSEITTALTLETYSDVTINNVKCDDIDASTMFGNLTINDGDVTNSNGTAVITPETFRDTAFRPDGVVPDFTRKLYFNQSITNFGA